MSEQKDDQHIHDTQESLYRLVLANILDAVFITDGSGNFTYICPNIDVVFGYSPQEVAAMGNVRALLGDQVITAGELQKADHVQNLERRITDKFGKQHIILVSVRQTAIDGGTILYSCHDISDRKLAEERWQESQKLYKQLFDHASDAILVIDDQKHITEANYQATYLTGYSKEELLAMKSIQLLPADAQAQYDEGHYHLVQQGYQTGEANLIRKDGTDIRVEFSATRIAPNQNQAILRDVTTRRIIEDARARLAAIVESTDEAVVTTGAHATITTWNHGAEELYGYSAAEVINQPITLIVPHERHHELRAIATHIRANECLRHFETQQLRKDGQRIDVSVTISPISDSNSHIVGASIIAHDISQRKREENEREQLITQLENAQVRAKTAANEEARRAKELDVIFSSLLDPIITYNAEGIAVQANPAAITGYGFNPIGMPRSTVVEKLFVRYANGTPMNADNVPSARALRGETVTSERMIVTNAEGRDLIVLASSVPLFTDHKITGAVVIWHDITEIEHLLEQLDEERSRLRTIFESVPAGIVVQNASGEITNANKSAHEILGLSHEQVLGRTSLDHRWHAIHEDGTPFRGEEHPAIISLTTGKPVRNVVMGVYNPASDNYRWIIINAEPIINAESKQLSEVIATFIDITGQKLATENVIRLAAIIDSSEDAVIGKDLNGIITSWNRAAEQLYGYTEAEVLGKSLNIIIPPEQTGELASLLDRIRHGERVQHYETTRVRKDGTRLQIAVTVSPIKDSSGHIVGASTITRDITAQKLAEHALRESEEKFRLLFQNMNEAMARDQIVFDNAGHATDWIVTDVNPAYEVIYKKTRDEVIGQRASVIYSGDPDITSVLNIYANVVHTGKPTQLEIHLVSINTDVLISAFPLGENMFATLSTDITARKRAEDERERLLAELDATISSIADGVVIYRANGEIARMNPTAMELTGYASGNNNETLKERFRAFQPKTVDGVAVSLEQFPAIRALHGETISGFAMILQRSNREPIWVSASAAPIRTEDGRLVGVVSTFTDITALHQLQTERDIYVHTISHDLRAPLTVIHGHAQVMQDTFERQHINHGLGNSVTAILRSTQRMNVMIQDLVDAARLEGRQMQLQLQPIELAKYMQELLQRVATAMEVKRITVQIPPDLPAVTADYNRLERILTNLLSNALKYSPPDSAVIISARQRGDVIITSVRDFGQGIAPGDLPHIFERFYRAAGTRKAEGIGLGLYITRMLVEAQGGEIWVESTPGSGSTFSFSLPIAHA
ncbi:MAG TPA: PAS domain S-box protein [Armatimonadota bacterium]|nr:PAS domain S-box protein [Armatimonadota bacterium]